ncbi:U3-containing 90S pre-ribosomal complex subunit-domain containing protein [Tuber indicum]|nr:U3-containing 90S pre-ribosomal complex subunit-domain containing protein [Tuber indicum]
MDSEDDYDGGVVLDGAETLDPSTYARSTPSTTDKRKRKREREKLNKQKGKKSKSEDDEIAPQLLEHRSKKETRKGGEVKSTATDVPGGETEPVNEDMARMDPKLLADYVAQRLKRFEKDLSSVELEDRYISESAFLDTTAFTSPRTLRNLPAYLESFSKFALIKSAATPGTPHTLILTLAAVRATDLARAVRKYQTKDSLVAKLFAKHIKLKDSITTCQTSRIGIGVGTPGRILDLLKEGVLKVDELKNVVIDASYVDKKGFGAFDIRETQKGIMGILGFAGVKARFERGEGRVMFY